VSALADRSYNTTKSLIITVKEAAIKIDEQLLKDIVHRVLAAAKPDKIILFGSAASGRVTRDSDIDLLIIEDNPGDLRKQSLRIRENLIGLGYPFDVIVISTE
jgi:predicted nucleotidyltransferase